MEVTLEADYNEVRAKAAKLAITGELIRKIDISNLPIEVAYADIGEVDNDTYVQIRKDGFGASDSSILLGCNPFKNREELISEKIRTTITAEERAIGKKESVRKGKDLEPLIIQKFQNAFQIETFKPADMYRFKEYPYLTVNFDGVTGTPEQYIPAEIKVLTIYGEKHYDLTKAMFNEKEGWKPLSEDVSKRNWSIEMKAAHYGIPPYYYTQLQQQMMALNAPFGHLSILRDRDWTMYTYYIYRDDMLLNELILQGYKTWNMVEQARGQGAVDLKIEKREDAVVQYMKEHHVSWAEASNAVHVVQPQFMTIKEKPINK